MIIQFDNNLDVQTTTQRSALSNAISSGGTSLPSKNINAFTAQDYVQLGNSGEEKAEIVALTSATPSGTALAVSGTVRFDHPQDTPIYDIVFNKIVVMRSTTGTAGTATNYGTVAITPDSLYTNFNDSSGVSTYAYKTKFYNDLTGVLSEESDWFVPGGPSMYSLSALREDVKSNLFSAGFLKADDSQIDSWINKWQENMNNSAIKVNQDYSIGTVDVAFGTSGLGTITSQDFKIARKVEVAYDGVNFNNSTKININGFSNTDNFSTSGPHHYWAGDTVFGIKPESSGGTARITYSKLLAKLDSDSDELTLALRSYTGGCVDYCLMRAYYNDQKIEMARDHRDLFLKSKQDFISEITPRDQTGPEFMEFVDELSGRTEEDIDF